ncbi:MAG: glycoside hydrolase family 2 TIM barrel-domain containing protein [Pirellulales bacterium]
MNVCRALALTLLFSTPSFVQAEPARVRVVQVDGRWQLTRNDAPYFIRGAGGDGPAKLLGQLGGNSRRTWGADRLGEQLDEAHRLGLTVTAGIWLGQVRQGFDWSDAASLIRQRAEVREVVQRYQHHPALLIWALGNEMEDPEGQNGAVWSEINNLARLVKSLDPHHPTMTVIAELGGQKVRHLHELCPDIDIVGINSYAGAATVGERYRKLGGTRPYILTEFGPPGIWEISRDAIGAYREPTSGDKAEAYRRAYRQAVSGQPDLCLGSYAFLWGQKQEVTATWFSLLLADGSRLAAVDALSELWTGQPPANRCPEIATLKLLGPAAVEPGSKVKLELNSSDPENDPLRVSWDLVADDEQYGTGGDAEEQGTRFPSAILQADARGAELQLPRDGGLYRVYVTVRDPHGGAATANVPIRVAGPVRTAAGQPASLPLVLYAESDTPLTYIPAGWMGDTKSIRLETAHREQPFRGATCLRCEFAATSGWGGVVWQHPARDWGDQRGGFNLTGAKRIVFQARGATGQEVVSFGFGLIGPEKRYADTARRNLEKVPLTRDWQTFEIPLEPLPANSSLTRIKTAFFWTTASSGQPVVFFLDDIRWE